MQRPIDEQCIASLVGIAQTLTSSQDSIEVDEHALPSYVPFSGIKDTVIASSVRAPLSATMSTGFGDITHGASRPITPDSAASVMTSAAKENKKKPERSKTPTPELTKGITCWMVIPNYFTNELNQKLYFIDFTNTVFSLVKFHIKVILTLVGVWCHLQVPLARNFIFMKLLSLVLTADTIKSG